MRIIKADVRPDGYVALYAQHPDHPSVGYWVYACAADRTWTFTYDSFDATAYAEEKYRGYPGIPRPEGLAITPAALIVPGGQSAEPSGS
ncbi:hypothetical protein [Actinomadura violacea]|uniref:Uncharacterized protein n=1 Tax=Actinomadura violacea TaxID=2819934 RepID=A0ABS3RXH9_9ACTN|nr:hypothetical protein [Actinomadura violacea]MBO2460988.1 hypothetical protein [Actinomadura violacea]